MLVRALPLFIPLSRDALPVSSPTRQHITKDMNCISKMNGLTDEQVISLTPLAPRKSPTFSTFNPDNLLPEPPIDVVMPHPLEPRKGISSPSDSGVSAVFEPLDDVPDQALADLTQPTTPPDEPAQFDLNPPPPSVSIANAESLHEKLYSADHLNIILRDPAMLSKFTSYVHTHRPYLVPVLSRYLDAQKAKSAVDYANAVAECMSSRRSHAAAHPPAAFLDSKFESQSLRAEEKLVNDALPGYITHRLVQLVTECLVKEITGSIAPIMQALVSGLAEVYCMTDPSLPDNPIVYASEEFYNVTQYGREYVIGRNCRFLQGPKTAPHSVSRLSKALSSGISVCETILNYRRDGSPFINLVMSAPLYDNKGRIRYFIGCQIDITNLIQGGRGLESFQRLLAQDRSESQFDTEPEKNTLKALNDFGTLLNENEIEALKRREIESQESPEPCSGRNTPAKPGSLRRYFGLDEALDHSQWTEPHLGRSGRLPGVYQNYFLVRPWPSLKITFTSPSLRIPGLVQTSFMDRIGGLQSIRDSIERSFSEGVGVTARITWLPCGRSQQERSETEGKQRWIHATPLLGSDEKVGVWMILMIENETITGSLNQNSSMVSTRKGPLRPQDSGKPLKPTGPGNEQRRADSKLYARYIRDKMRSPDSWSCRHVPINPTPLLPPEEEIPES